MTCLVLIQFRAKKDAADKIPGWLREILPDTRGRDGCVGVSVTRNQDDPTRFAFVEQWATRQHYERYFAWRKEQGVLDELAGFLDGEASFEFYDYVAV